MSLFGGSSLLKYIAKSVTVRWIDEAGWNIYRQITNMKEKKKEKFSRRIYGDFTHATS